MDERATNSTDPDPTQSKYRLTLTGRPSAYNSFLQASSRNAGGTVSQERVLEILNSREVSITIALMICFNSALVILQTDAKARGEDPQPWEIIAGIALLVCFTLELGIRLYASPVAFFSEWVLIAELMVYAVDMILLAVSWLGVDKMSISYLKFVRFVRLRRVVRLLRRYRELYMMLHGMESAFKAMFWAFIIVAGILLMWSIVAVELMRPLAQKVTFEPGDERSARAFDCVWIAALSLVETAIAGDNWGGLAIPMMKEYPLSAFFFFGSFLTINLSLLNLIVAVIVDRAAEARAEDEEYIIFEKEKAFAQAHDKFLHICKDLDLDHDGQISWTEFRAGVTNVPEFAQALKLLDIGTDDLERVFRYVDADNSGTLSYNEFIRQVHRLKTVDSHAALILLGQQITNICRDMDFRVRHALTLLSGSVDSMMSHSSSMEAEDKSHDSNIMQYARQRSTPETKSRSDVRYETSHGLDKDIRLGLEQLKSALDNQIVASIASLQDSLAQEHACIPEQNMSMHVAFHQSQFPLRESATRSSDIDVLQTSSSTLQNAVEIFQPPQQESISAQVSVTKIETTTSIERARLCCA